MLLSTDSGMRTIVLAWLDDDVEVARQRRTDLGERPETRAIKVVKTVIWVHQGMADDVEAAEVYARKHCDPTTRVYSVSTTDPEPRTTAAKMRMDAYVSPTRMQRAILETLQGSRGRGLRRVTLAARLATQLPEVDEALMASQLRWLEVRFYVDTKAQGPIAHHRVTQDGIQYLSRMPAG